jgi:twitching motility protein PilT
MQVNELLRITVEKGASDLHIKVGRPPGLRIHGLLLPLEDLPPFTVENVESFADEITTAEQKAIFEAENELDFAYSVPELSRFRVNIFKQQGLTGLVLRAIPIKIQTIKELNLPPIVAELSMRPRGLVLVVGITGSGKSTTLAAMIDHINSNKQKHIVTIEDPIEFWHEDKMSYVNQREVGRDTESFHSALKRVLRQDPDVILVGELRDLDTTKVAVTAAETGHLVLGTLHTPGAAQTIDRIIDMYPAEQQNQIRIQLSMTLQGVLAQNLLPRRGGDERVLAMEIMAATTAIRSLVREGKTHQIPLQIQTGAEYGMQTLDQALKTLFTKGLITGETAMEVANNPEELSRMLRESKSSLPASSPRMEKRRRRV